MPDREIDALIAQKMGWVLLRGRWWTADQARSEYTVERWRPSTDIAAAWDVAVKFGIAVIPIEGGFLAGRFNDSYAPAYIDSEIGVIDGRMDHYATAAIAPLAICRAALQAVGVPVPSHGH